MVDLVAEDKGVLWTQVGHQIASNGPTSSGTVAGLQHPNP